MTEGFREENGYSFVVRLHSTCIFQWSFLDITIENMPVDGQNKLSSSNETEICDSFDPTILNLQGSLHKYFKPKWD